MGQLVIRNSILVIGLVVAGFMLAQAAPAFVSARGGSGPTIFHAQSPMKAAAFTAATALGCAAVAVAMARLINVAVAVFVLGGGFFVLASRLADVSELAFAGGSRSALLWLAVETLLWSIALLPLVIAVFALGGWLRDVHPRSGSESVHWIRSTAALKAAAAGALVLPVVWIFGRSPMTGQLVAAVFCGSLLAGLVGRLASPHVQPVLLCVSPVFFGAVGHVLAWLFVHDPLDKALVNGTLPAWGMVMPAQYAAGSLAGVAMGLGWARSFLQHEDSSDAAPEPLPRAPSA